MRLLLIGLNIIGVALNIALVLVVMLVLLLILILFLLLVLYLLFLLILTLILLVLYLLLLLLIQDVLQVLKDHLAGVVASPYLLDHGGRNIFQHGLIIIIIIRYATLLTLLV